MLTINEIITLLKVSTTTSKRHLPDVKAEAAIMRNAKKVELYGPEDVRTRLEAACVDMMTVSIDSPYGMGNSIVVSRTRNPPSTLTNRYETDKIIS